MDVIIAAVSAGIGGVIAGLAAAYVLIRRTNSELKVKEMAAKAGEDDKARRQERTEYKALYGEIKSELMRAKEESRREIAQVRAQDRKCQRRCRRLELAIVGAGIELPPLEADDSEDSETPTVDNPSGGK